MCIVCLEHISYISCYGEIFLCVYSSQKESCGGVCVCVCVCTSVNVVFMSILNFRHVCNICLAHVFNCEKKGILCVHSWKEESCGGMYVYPCIPYLKVPWISDIYILYVSNVSLDVLLWRNDSVCSLVQKRIVWRNVCVSMYSLSMNTLNIRHIYIIYVSTISCDVLLWKSVRDLSFVGMYICISYLVCRYVYMYIISIYIPTNDVCRYAYMYIISMNTLDIRNVCSIYLEHTSWCSCVEKESRMFIRGNMNCVAVCVYIISMRILNIRQICITYVLYIFNIPRAILSSRNNPECSFVEIWIVLRYVYVYPCISHWWISWIWDIYVSHICFEHISWCLSLEK